jgi:hypothetical protein
MHLFTLRNLGIAFAAAVYCVLFVEFFLRLMAPQVLMPRYITGTDYGVRANIANAVYEHLTEEADVEMRINAQGMRADRDIPQTKPANTCRIALLGDSYFMGYEVSYEYTLGALLEEWFAEEGYRVEILNFAVSGFSTEEMIHAFDARATAFETDIAIFQFNGGDFNDNMRPGLYRMDENGVPQRTGASYLPGVAIRDYLMQFGVYRWLISSSHAYSAIREWAGRTGKKILTWLGGLRAGPQIKAKTPPAEEVQENVQEDVDTGPGRTDTRYKIHRKFPKHQVRYTSALIELSRERTEAEGISWLLLEIPDPGFYTWFSNLGHLRLKDETWARVVTPMDAFETWTPEDPPLYRFKGHFHLTELGHELTTRTLIDTIKRDEQELLAGCRI